MNSTPAPARKRRAISIRHLANCITICRLVLSAVLLVLDPGSLSFFAVYLLAGVTDMVDGLVARKTHTESRTGALLDSVCDLVFTAVCFYRLFPLLSLPRPVWLWAAAIAALRIFHLLLGLALRHQLVLLHTQANRVTGCLLFAFPLTLPFFPPLFPAVLLCLAASFATLQEGYRILTGF